MCPLSFHACFAFVSSAFPPGLQQYLSENAIRQCVSAPGTVLNVTGLALYLPRLAGFLRTSL